VKYSQSDIKQLYVLLVIYDQGISKKFHVPAN